MTTYQRFNAGDWVKEVDGYGSYNTTSFTQLGIAHGALWFSGPYVNAGAGTSGSRYLYGISLIDGSPVATIDVVGLGGSYFRNMGMAVDQNGYIWLLGADGFNASNPAVNVVDVINNTLIATAGTQSSGNYGDSNIIFDETNNQMWLYRSSTKLQAISTVSYTEVLQIVDNANGGFAFDPDNNHMWAFNYTSNTIKRYNATTGASVSTVSSSFTLNATTVVYIPELKIMLASDNQDAEAWSTLTLTKVGTIAVSGGNDDFRALHYNDGIRSIISYHYDDAEGVTYLSAYDIDNSYAETRYVLDLLPNDDPINDQIVHAAITIDDNKNIYLGVDKFNTGDSSYTTYMYKIAYMPGSPMRGDGESITVNPATIVGDSGLYTNQNDAFNRELILDLDLGAFYVNDFGHTGFPKIHDYIRLPGYAIRYDETLIYAGTESVIVTAGDTVVVNNATGVDRSSEPRAEQFKYLTTSSTSFTISEYKDFDFVDFASYDGLGANFSSYLVTGYDLSQDMMRRKRAIYLIVYCERTETIYTLTSDGVVLARQSGCIIQPQWDWASSPAQGKWGQSFQAYRFLNNRTQPTSPAAGDTFDYGERVIITKNKLRGSGRSLSLFIQSQDGKDMKLLGWGIDQTRQDFV